MQLIYSYDWGDESCGGVEIIPFEYSSKEDFIKDVFIKMKDAIKKGVGAILVLDYPLSIDIASHIKYSVFTLEEWFEKNKREFKK